MTVYYAIGDVHGMDEMLEVLHATVFEDMARQTRPTRLVHLGDYVDRGPSSWQVVERVKALHDAGKAICLLGNHEEMMYKAIRHGRMHDVLDWERNGGHQTIDSYGGKYEDVPQEHLLWMEGLPYNFVDQTEKLVFVHAGLEPDDFPQISREVALWTRARRFASYAAWKGTPLANWMVVHGHSITNGNDEWASDGKRINVDYGAFRKSDTAQLVCVRIEPGHKVTYISVTPDLRVRQWVKS
jgi:serine/threonine protein phosphatase 1